MGGINPPALFLEEIEPLTNETFLKNNF